MTTSTAGPPKSETAWLKERRKSWARLIRRVYEADPLLCRCGQWMRVVGFITQAPVIRKILDHVGRRFEPLVLPSREMWKKKIPISGCGSFAWPGFLQDGDVHGHPLLLEWRCETTPVTCRFLWLRRSVRCQAGVTIRASHQRTRNDRATIYESVPGAGWGAGKSEASVKAALARSSSYLVVGGPSSELQNGGAAEPDRSVT